MTLRDTSAAPLTATADEIRDAICWAITAAEHEAARVIRRDTGLDRQTAKRLETTYRGHARSLAMLAASPAPTTGREDDQRYWVVLQEPRCVPDRKGPWSSVAQVKEFMREVMDHRPTAQMTVLTLDCYGDPDVQHGGEWLQIMDGRSSGRVKRHNASCGAALAHPPAGEGWRPQGHDRHWLETDMSNGMRVIIVREDDHDAVAIWNEAEEVMATGVRPLPAPPAE